MPTVPVTVWHQEMLSPTEFRPSTRPPAYALVRLTAPAPDFFRFLYAAVGGPWHWTDRLAWPAEAWAGRLADPMVEVWVGYDGGAPLGWFELCRQADGTVELVYFGLLPHAVGQGHGGPLLTAAVSRAWALGAKRVYVNSCSLDHPSAMANYGARGFRVFREEVKTKEI
ncbi:MAG TPA: GNAT family N-acetyltransferase [Gemmatimonadales bacterium]